MRRLALVFVPVLVVVAGCSGSGERRVTIDQIADPAVDVSDATGIDLGEEVNALFPTGDLCTSLATVPLRWFQDAPAPMQLSVDSFGSSDPPAEAQAEVDALVGFGESRLRWHFQGGERPAWTAEHEAAERSLAEWAVANCELPAVIGPGAGAAPPSWTDLSDDEIADNCNWGREQIVEAAAEYVDLFGAPAEHPILLESHLELYFGSDFFTLGPGGDAIAAPGGACDI